MSSDREEMLERFDTFDELLDWLIDEVKRMDRIIAESGTDTTYRTDRETAGFRMAYENVRILLVGKRKDRLKVYDIEKRNSMSRVDRPELMCDKCHKATLDLTEMSRFRKVSQYNMNGKIEWDLCPDCWKLFRGFMEEKQHDPSS